MTVLIVTLLVNCDGLCVKKKIKCHSSFAFSSLLTNKLAVVVLKSQLTDHLTVI